MQRVSALLPAWDRNSRGSQQQPQLHQLQHTRNSSLEKVRGWADKIPSPVNRLSTNRLGREAFWPGTLDKECEKAARILKSFCSDGYAAPDDHPSSPQTFASGSSANSNRVLRKIPPMIIQNAIGLAVFTSMRSGLWTSGSGGSGVLVSRKPDGSWSPPSGLTLQTPSLGFALGVDIYDCVLVINNFTVLEVFARHRFTLGTDVAMTPGPLVTVGLLENDLRCTDLSDTVISYVKGKGQAADVKLDGTVLTERTDENERYYGMSLAVPKILAGDINQSLPQTRPLTEVLKAAEGRTDYDAALLERLSAQPAPGDVSIESPQSATSMSPNFGVPDNEDPDPFGVMALEMAGMGIREAGSRLRPESSQFDYSPSPTSPVFAKAGRRSVDTFFTRSNRGSYMSNRTTATVFTERSQMTDAGTQTFTHTPETTPSPSQSQSEDGHPSTSGDEAKEPEEVDYTKIDMSAIRKLTQFPDLEEEALAAAAPSRITSIKEEEPLSEEPEEMTDSGTNTSPIASNVHEAEDEHDADDEEGEDNDSDDEAEEEFEDAEDEPVVFEVATAQAPQRMAMMASQGVQAKGAMVTIPKRVTPPVPTRNPARASRRKSQMGEKMVSSPLRQEFDLGPEPEDPTTPRALHNTTGSILEGFSGAIIDENEEILEKASEIAANATRSPEQPSGATRASQDSARYVATSSDERATQDGMVGSAAPTTTTTTTTTTMTTPIEDRPSFERSHDMVPVA